MQHNHGRNTPSYIYIYIYIYREKHCHIHSTRIKGCTLEWHFRHICLHAHLTNCSFFALHSQATLPHIKEHIAVCDIFSTKHDLDSSIKPLVTTGTLMYQFFPKSIHFKVPYLRTPLSSDKNNTPPLAFQESVVNVGRIVLVMRLCNQQMDKKHLLYQFKFLTLKKVFWNLVMFIACRTLYLHGNVWQRVWHNFSMHGKHLFE